MNLTVRDLAERLQESEKTILRWVEDGLPSHEVNGQHHFNGAEFVEWASSRDIPIPPQLFGNDELSASVSGLPDALTAGGVYSDLKGTDKSSVLKSLVDVMRLPRGADREMMHHFLMAREELESTGIGDGIAIPHARNPMVLHGARPMVALGFLAQPVDFGAIDGKPVHTLFLVVSPTARAHLHLISRVAYALKHEGFRRAVLAKESLETLLKEARQMEVDLRARK